MSGQYVKYPQSGGSQGVTGVRGPTGPSGGPVGATGLVGPQGVTGIRGLTGLQGPAGVTGFGLQGVTGLAGAGGVTGPSGGAQGETGVGLQGETGLQGIQGATGIDGLQGETGAGIDGATGLQGETGIAGIQGETGLQGIAGATGVAGIQGQTGIQGITGLGVQGVTGLIGNTGVIGTVGQTGVQGVTGYPSFPILSSVSMFDDLISSDSPSAVYTSAGGQSFGGGAMASWDAHTGGSFSFLGEVDHPGIRRFTVGTTSNTNTFLGFAAKSVVAGTNTLQFPYMFSTSNTFTVETMFRFSSTDTSKGGFRFGLFESAPAANSTISATVKGAYFEMLSTTTNLIPYSFNTTTFTGTTTALSIDTWYRLTIVYNGTSLEFFVNGASKSSTTTASDIASSIGLVAGFFHRGLGVSISYDFDSMALSYTTSR